MRTLSTACFILTVAGTAATASAHMDTDVIDGDGTPVSPFSSQAALDASAAYMVQVWGPDEIGALYVDLLKQSATEQDESNGERGLVLVSTYTTSSENLESVLERALSDARNDSQNDELLDWQSFFSGDDALSVTGTLSGLLTNGGSNSPARRVHLPLRMQLYSLAVPAPGTIMCAAIGTVVCARRRR